MEEQLAAYRAKKAKELSSISNAGGLFGSGLFTRNRRKDAPQQQTEIEKDASQDDTGMSSEEKRDDADGVNEQNVNAASSRTQFAHQSSSSKPYSTSTINPYQLTLKVILWLALFGLFICIGFGAVFFILSLFYIIYRNLRGEGEKTPGEKSAYSVFNPECERIHGTLTAEEIQKGMLLGI